MNRFNELQKKAASAAAALALSAIFIGAAVGPAVNAPVVAQANVERAAA
jgi:energy-converting hydrogenase Eha subunit E